MLLSSTVMTPSLPTLSIASAMISPTRGVTGGDGGGGGDLLLGLHVLGELGQLLRHARDGGLDAPLQGHRVRAGGDVAQALTDQRLGEDGRRRRAVTGNVVGLLGDLLDQLGADLLVRVLELDLLGDAHTIVGDGGGAPLLLEHDVAALGAERHLDGVGEGVHAPLEAAARLLVERDDLGHTALSSWTLAAARPGRPRSFPPVYAPADVTTWRRDVRRPGRIARDDRSRAPVSMAARTVAPPSRPIGTHSGRVPITCLAL